MTQNLSTENDQTYADPEKCFFFWKNIWLSNWDCSHPFVLDGIDFDCVERAMMLGKAIVFKDFNISTKIMELPEKSQNEIKKLGREVKNFNQKVWDETKYEIVKRAVLQKFIQNVNIAHKVLSTGDKMLIEASPYDKIWGIGYTAQQALKVPIDQWGENLLGKILMEVRAELRTAFENT